MVTFFANICTFAMQGSNVHKKQKLMEATSSRPNNPARKLQDPAWQGPNASFELLNYVGNYLTSKKTALPSDSPERRDLSNDLTSLSVVSKGLRANLAAAQIAEIAFSLEIYFLDNQLKIKLVPINQPPRIQAQLKEKKVTLPLKLKDYFVLDAILEDYILKQNDPEGSLASDAPDPQHKVLPIYFGNVKKVTFIFNSLRGFRQFLNLKHSPVSSSLQFSEETKQVLTKIYHLFMRTNKTIIDPTRAVPEFYFKYTHLAQADRLEYLKILAENCDALLHSAKSLPFKFKLKIRINVEAFLKKQPNTQISLSQQMHLLSIFFNRISSHGENFHFYADSEDQANFFTEIERLESLIDPSAETIECFHELARLLETTPFMELFKTQLPPLSNSFSNVGKLRNRSLLRIFLNCCKEHLADWQIEKLDFSVRDWRYTSTPEFLLELVSLLTTSHFKKSQKSATATLMLLIDKNFQGEVRLRLLNKLDADFFQQARFYAGDTIIGLPNALLGDLQGVTALLDLVPDNLFLMPNSHNMTPLELIARGGYSADVSLALLARISPEAYKILDADDKNVLHNLSPYLGEQVLDVLLNKAPRETFLQKDRFGNLPIHILCEKSSFNVLQRLLQAVPESFYASDRNGNSILNYINTVTQEKAEAMMRLAPLTSFFVKNKTSSFNSNLAFIYALSFGKNQQKRWVWETLIVRIENTSPEEFNQKDSQGETFFSLLMKENVNIKGKYFSFFGYLHDAQAKFKFLTVVFDKIDKESLASYLSKIVDPCVQLVLKRRLAENCHLPQLKKEASDEF
jgi:hypothetical protein